MTEKIKKEICCKLLDVMKKNSEFGNEQIENMKDAINTRKSYVINDRFEDGAGAIFQKIENAENEINNKIEEVKSFDEDFEIWKSQKTCGGLVKRWGRIKDCRLLTSKIKPVNKPYKDKTQYLKKSSHQRDMNNRPIPNIPWDSTNSPYRLVINYNGGTFHLYFNDERHVKTVEKILFPNNQQNDQKEKQEIKNTIHKLDNCIKSAYRNYGIKKMIDVKNKVKKGKILLSQIKNLSEENHNSIVKFAKDNLNTEVIKSYEKEVEKPIENKTPINLRGKKKPKSSDLETMSTTLPLLSPITAQDSSKQPENMELSELMKKLEKFEKLKNKEQIDINKLNKKDNKICSFKNISVNEVCDLIPEKDAELYKNEKSDFGFPDLESIKQAKEIIVDKGLVNLIFVQDAKNNEPKENSQLNNNNIYDISNVFLNTDINTNKVVENNLVIYGPKLDLAKTYNYKIKNQQDEYLEPEIVHEKFMNGFSCKQENKFIRLQIFHLIYYISKNSLDKVIENIDPNLSYKSDHPEDIFIFMLSVTIQGNKKKKLRPVKAKKYENDYFVIEFNNEIIIDKNDILEDGIKLEVEMIPIPTLQQISKKNQQYIIDLLAMNQYIDYFYIGNLIFKKDSNPQNYLQYEFQLSKNGRNVNHTTLVAKFTECEGDFYRFNGFYGKDYSLGDYTYIIKEVDKQFFDNLKSSNYISKDKLKSFDNKFDDQNQILFRIPEDPNKALEFEQDMQNEISDKDLNKIKYNSKFKYLPECTKFINKESFKKEKAYESLTDFGKSKIERYKSKWFYKSSDLKMKILTRNIGIDRSHNISQKNLIDGTTEYHNLKNNKDLITLSDNTFNLLDMKEINPNSCYNFNNFQWAFSIKFNDQTQMVTFVKLLKYLRQKSNYDMLIKQIQEENPISGISVILRENKKTKIEGDDDKKSIGNNWIAAIESLNIRNDYKIPGDSNLYFQLKRKNVLYKKKNTKCLLTTLNNNECNYKNSLLNNQNKLKDEYEKIINQASESNNKNEFDFNLVNHKENVDLENCKKYMEIKSERFNRGKKNLNFKHAKEKFEVKMDLNSIEHNMDCLMWLENNKSKEKQYFVTKTMDLNNITSCNQADFFILPLYQVEENELNSIDLRSIDKSDRKIYGKLRVNFYKDTMDEGKNKRFEELYYEDNKQKYINSLDSNSLSTSIDSIISYKYNPNVLRRVTANDLSKKTKKLMNKVIADVPINNIIYKQVHEYYDKKSINHKCENRLDE